jgi:hypothetical protein
VLLSLQRALWCTVTPDLVAVAVGWETGAIHARFVYLVPLPPVRREIVSEVETYVVADFAPEVRTEFGIEVESDDNARTLAPGEAWWAYVRRSPIPVDRPHLTDGLAIFAGDRDDGIPHGCPSLIRGG